MRRFSKTTTTILKAVAICLIIIQHFGQALSIGVVNPLGPIGVFLFLFLSGYGLTFSFNNAGRKYFFQKKVFKVYIPYFVTILFGNMFLWMTNKGFEVVKLLKNSLLIELFQASHWYLLALFYWYVIFYLLTFFIEKQVYRRVFWVFTSVLLLLLTDFSSLFVWLCFSFPLVVESFYLNRTISLFKAGKVYSKKALIMLALGIGLTILKQLPFVETNELGVFDNVLSIGITMSFGILILFSILELPFLEKVNRIFLSIGDYSYELYLAHVLFLDLLSSK